MGEERTVHDPDLVALLVACSHDLHEHTPKLIAADRAAELEMTNLEKTLRWLATCDTKGIHNSLLFTGSRCYGMPTVYSDVDWVICVNDTTMTRLKETADVICGMEYVWDAKGAMSVVVNRELDRQNVSYDNTGLLACAVRMGPLNLICVSYEEQWSCWRDGTLRLRSSCIGEGPRTRKQAVDEFQRLWRQVMIRPAYRNRGWKLHWKI